MNSNCSFFFPYYFQFVIYKRACGIDGQTRSHAYGT